MKCHDRAQALDVARALASDLFRASDHAGEFGLACDRTVADDASAHHAARSTAD